MARDLDQVTVLRNVHSFMAEDARALSCETQAFVAAVVMSATKIASLIDQMERALVGTSRAAAPVTSLD